MKKNELTLKQILAPLSDEQINSLNRSELIIIAQGEQKLRLQYEETLEKLSNVEALNKELQEQKLLIEGKYVRIKSKLYGPKSEKITKKHGPEKVPIKTREKTIKLPSERYPNIPIIEKEITFEAPPECQGCLEPMQDSGMVESSEYLTVIPKQYLIVRQLRHKYRCCKCHGDVQTAPSLPRVIPGSSYSDEMIIDVTLSKYCDLIPIERYSAMAKRQGIENLPPHSLIGITHKLAIFLIIIYKMIMAEILESLLLLGDETPHKMLEGDDTRNWYLWCFSSLTGCYFEYHDTRAAKVASAIINKSKAKYFMSDAYSGYGKAIREANIERKNNNLPPLIEALCNSHSRREFRDSAIADSEYFINQYAEIYKLEKEVKIAIKLEKLDLAKELRNQMRPFFEGMKQKAEEFLESYSSKSKFYGACNYYLKNYPALTRCLDDILIPLDNNQSERQLRSPVIGRKTWYGTHSKIGAQTAAIHFTLVESCKLIGVNPRDYYQEVVKELHQGRPAFTPKEYLQRLMIIKEKDRPLS